MKSTPTKSDHFILTGGIATCLPRPGARRPLSGLVSSSLAVAAMLAISGTSARAIDLQWDPDATPPPTGGTGNWDTSGAFWFNGAADVPWNNANFDSAIFGGTAGTVTLTTGISANGLQFDTPGYIVTGNTLTLGGATTPLLEANQRAIVNSVLAGTGGVTVTGSGLLALGGTNTFTGQMTISPGAIVGLTSGGALGANGTGNETIVQAGGMLNIGGQSINNAPPPATPGEEIRIAGTGVGGLGAIINTSAGNTNTLAKVVLTADATIGAGAGIATSYGIGGNIITSAGGRTDIRVNAAPTAGQRHLDLNGFTLTKSGSHLLALVNADVSDGNIIVNEGQLNIEGGTLLQGSGTITVNPNGKFGFWGVTAAGNVTRPIVVNGGTIGDPTNSNAAQTVNSPITVTGSVNPNFTSVSGNVTTLAGLISENAASTITEVAKRGSGALAFSNVANSFDAPVVVYQGTLRGDYATALAAGGVPPAAPLTTTDTPLGTNPTIRIAGGTLALRINMANDGTNQSWDLNRTVVIDNAPGAMTFDRLSNGSQTDKHVVVDSLIFAAPSAANGYSIGQNQLTFTQGNTHRLEIPSMTMNSDTVLTTGDFTLAGDINSAGRYSLVHTGGNTIQIVAPGTQQFNAYFNLGAANMRVGSGFGTPVTNDTVTLGTGSLYNAPNNAITFRTPGNLAAGQTLELVSQQVAQSTANFEQFTSVPTNLRALGSGVIGVGNATAFGDIDLSRIGDGTFRLGSNFGGSGNGTIVGNITPGVGGIVRSGAAGTMTVSGTNAISGSAALEVGSDLINGGFRTAGTGGAQNGTVLLTAPNAYTGGTTVNRSSTLRFQNTASIGSGPISVFGTITPELNASFAAANGNDNAFTPTILGGGGIHFNNGGQTGTVDTNRWGDTVPLALTAGLLQITSRNNDASTTNETIGPVTFTGGTTINLSRQNAVTGNIAQLTLASLTRTGQGTIELARTTGTGAGYGVGQKLLVTAAPAVVNGMVSPWIVAQNNGPQEFLTYGATGYVPITFDATVTTGTYTAGTVPPTAKVDVTTAALTLTDDPTLYALRTAVNINSSGTNDTITIGSGGIISNVNTGTITIAPNLVFNDGTANVEGIINSRSGGTLSLTGTLTGNGLTKFGAGTLMITADNATTLTGNVAVNQGVLQLHGPTATANYNPVGTGPITLQGGQLNLRSNNSAVTGTINPTLQNNGVIVPVNVPLAVIDVNRSGADTASSGTFIFNPAAAGAGLQLLGSPGTQGQTITVSGANYSLQFGTNASNSFAGNVTMNNAVTVTMNNAPAITGTAPVITKSGGGNWTVGTVAGTTAPDGTQVVLNAGTLELRSVTAFGTAVTTSLLMNAGTLNLRRDSAGTYGNTVGYPVTVNGNSTLSADRVSAGSNFAEGIGAFTINGSPTLTVNNGNGVYPNVLARADGVSLQLNGLPFLASNVAAGSVDSALRFNGTVVGGGFVKLGSGHLHLLGANSTYDGGTFINQGIVRARATNAFGTGPIFLNPGAIVDFNAIDNRNATQPLIVRSNSAFAPMISVNTDIAHPTTNVDTSNAPVGIVGLSNGTGGTYNTAIDLGALYGGKWYLGGVSAGAYDPIYTGATLGAGAGNLYRLGGGGTSFAMGTDGARAARTNVLTGPNNVQLGFDSSNILPVNNTNFQYSIAGTNNFTGGSTTIHRGMVARVFSNNNGTQSGLSNSAVDVFGNLSISGAASLGTGTANTNAVTLNPGAGLIFDNANGAANGIGAFAAANVTDRWNDTTPIGLNGALINIIGATDVASSEVVGDVTYRKGARIRVARGGTTTGTATLTMNNLFGAGAGNTLHLQTSAAGTLGGVDKIIVTNSPPPVTNGMVSPSIVNLTDNTFVTYGSPNGFANVTYDSTVAASPIPVNLAATAKVDIAAGGAVSLSDNPVIYALRTNRDINNAGPFTTLTLRSGGLIGQTNTLSIQPHLVFNDGVTNIEARIYNSSTVNINGTITANGVTKFGTGNLSVNVPQVNYAQGWTVNSGTLQINDLQGLGQSVPGNGVTLNATQTTAGLASVAFGQTQLILNRDTGSPELAVFTGGPITVVNEGTLRIAGTDNRNLQGPAVILDSTTPGSRVAFTFDVPNNRFRGIIPNLTLNDDALIRVFDSGSQADTGRVTTGAVDQLTGTGKNLTKIGNRTLELSSDNSGTFTGGSITVSQGTIRVRNNGALGSATTATTIERNATLEIASSNFTPTGTVTQLPGSIERWNVENARGATYTLPAGVNLQLNTNLNAARTINLTGGSIEGFLWTDHPAPAVQRNISSAVTVNLQADSSVGQNILQGQGYDAGRQPTVEQPFGDNITGAYLRIEGNITGAFNLTKTGLDTAVIAGAANAYNNTIVDMGTLRSGRDNALPAARTLTTRFDGTFDLNGFDQTVTGLGTVTGSPDAGGNDVGSSGRVVNGAITTDTLTVNNTANFTYSGTIDRNVALTKTGTGELILAGTNGYVGATTVGAGTLKLTGSISGSPTIDVQTGASFDVAGVPGGYTLGSQQLLKGNGTVVGSANIAGIIAPGSGVGTLTLTGSADFDPGSTFALEINGNSSFDQLVANGVTLDGPVNLTISLGGPVTPNTSFLVLNNTSATPIGGTTGAFTWSGPEGLLTQGEHFSVNGQEFVISYQGGAGGNDVVLQAVPEPATAMTLVGGLATLIGLQRFRRRHKA